jgi:RNA polymerase sigma-70 factor (ECF subfamily)
MGPSCNSTLDTPELGPPASEEALPVPPRDAEPTHGRLNAAGGPDDAELLRQIGRGDQAAFRTLVDRHARYLYGIAATLAGPADAEDVVQETFAAVLSAKFRGESAVRTWLVQILVRQAAMARRKRRRPMASLDAGGGSIAADSAAAASEIAGAEAKLDLAVMLKTLSAEHRQVIVLREVEGMSYDEMARALGVPRGTIESRLHRARAELRERFKGYL